MRNQNFEGRGERAPGKGGRHGRGKGPGKSKGEGRGKRGGRMFDYGDLRLLVLALASDALRHGYELIKTIEKKFDGAYVPSPGVIYPTLDWLVDMAFVEVAQDGSGRKQATITEAGQAFLTANTEAVAALWARKPMRHKEAPEEIAAAMDALKVAMRKTVGTGEDATQVCAVAAKIQALATEIAEGAGEGD